MSGERFTVKPRWFWRQLIPWPMWCRERRDDGYPGWELNGSQCRFRYKHPFPHEDHSGYSWPLAGSGSEEGSG